MPKLTVRAISYGQTDGRRDDPKKIFALKR